MSRVLAPSPDATGFLHQAAAIRASVVRIAALTPACDISPALLDACRTATLRAVQLEHFAGLLEQEGRRL